MIILVIIFISNTFFNLYSDPISAVTVHPGGYPVEGATFNLSCNVVGPVDSIHWMKNGKYLDVDDTITFFNNNSTLSFYHPYLSDDGLYQCAASNDVSNMTSPAYNLTVNCEYDISRTYMFPVSLCPPIYFFS